MLLNSWLSSHWSTYHGDTLAIQASIDDSKTRQITLNSLGVRGLIKSDTFGGCVTAAATCLNITPVVTTLIDHSWRLDRSIDSESCLQSGTLAGEFLSGKHSLRILQVRASQSFGLPFLQGAVLVVEPFGASASGRCQVSVILELPVGPSN